VPIPPADVKKLELEPISVSTDDAALQHRSPDEPLVVEEAIDHRSSSV
jgi:hypothetical protein